MFEQVAAHLPRAICREFRLALDNGHWGSGLALTEQQKRTCEEALFFHENNMNTMTH